MSVILPFPKEFSQILNATKFSGGAPGFLSVFRFFEAVN